MTAIFISYRRDDSAAHAGRLYDTLSAHFGAERIFMDVDSIKPGDDFAKVLDETESRSAALVVVIGRTWLTIRSADGSARLLDPQDFVRREIAAGLQRNLRLFPVLVGGASMPRSEDLPPDLAPLAHVQALVIHDDAFHRDTDQLIAALDQIVSAPPPGAALAGTWRASIK
jgi:TIR domain